MVEMNAQNGCGQNELSRVKEKNEETTQLQRDCHGYLSALFVFGAEYVISSPRVQSRWSAARQGTRRRTICTFLLFIFTYKVVRE